MPLLDAEITPAGCIVSIAIHVSAGRYQALTQAGQTPPQAFRGVGLVDSGASNTMIDHSVVQALGLQPTGVVPTLTPSTGPTPHLCDQYDVSVWFPQAPTLIQAQPSPHPIQLTLPVSGADFSAFGFDVLIGRDILGHGVFIYNGLTGRFTLAF
jgi:hypothetical protein